MSNITDYMSVCEAAKLWNISERSVRNYCALGKISDAILVGKTWKIPENAVSPARNNKYIKLFLDVLSDEKKFKIKDGIYAQLQVDFTYNSNRMEDNSLTYNDVLYMFEFNEVNLNRKVSLDDIVETANHFKCVDMCIKNARYQLTENFIRQLFLTLKNGTKASREDFFISESYKKFSDKVKSIIDEYNSLEHAELKDILTFQSQFEVNNPLIIKDRRIGRLLVLKECLKNNISPFALDYKFRDEYYYLLENPTSNMVALCSECHKAQEGILVRCQNRAKI